MEKVQTSLRVSSDRKLFEYNRRGAVQSLPNELLVQVFEHYGPDANARQPLDPHKWMDVWRGTAPRKFGGRFQLSSNSLFWEPGPTRCFTLMLVCRLWRDLALATPSLWQVVDVSQHTRWLKLALVRSRHAQLDLFFRDLRTARNAVSDVLPHVVRLRTLVLPPLDRLPYSPPVWKVSPIVPFLPLLTSGRTMQALEELILSVEIENRPQIQRAQLDLPHDKFPSLRVLRISCVSVPWNRDMLSHLTTLDLRASVANGPSPSCDHFLDVLEHGTALHELRLLDSFVSATLGVGGGPRALDAEMVNPDRTLHLPRLRKLVLADIPSVTAWLLSHLIFAPDISTVVVGWLPDVDMEPKLPEGAFTSLVPCHDLAVRFFPGTMPTHGLVTMRHDKAVLSVHSGDRSAELSLQLRARGGSNAWPYQLLLALQEFRRLFAGFPISELNITGTQEESEGFEEWTALFDAFPHLQTLEFSTFGSIAPLLHALMHTQTPDTSDTPRAPPCARLQQLRLTSGTYAIGHIEILVAALQHRAHLGLGPIESLKLELGYGDEHEACVEEVKAYLGDLKMLCPDISY